MKHSVLSPQSSVLFLLVWAGMVAGVGRMVMGAEEVERFVPPVGGWVASATLEMREEAVLFGSEIRLKQVVRWSEADARTFAPVADLIVARVEAGKAFRSIDIGQVKQTLEGAGINLGQIRFTGAIRCMITRSDVSVEKGTSIQQWVEAKEAKVQPVIPVSTPVAAVEVPTTQPVNLSIATDETGLRSLRQLLVADLSVRASLPVDQLQVDFNPQDQNVINLVEPFFKFNIEPRRYRGLGAVSWDVTITSDAGVQKASVSATARAWQNQLVVSRPLSYRQVIQAADVVERRMLVDQLDGDPILVRAQVVGQQASRDLKPGTVITARMVDPVLLVQNGQLVMVTLRQGGIEIKTVARALEGGSFGQSIRVRSDVTKEILEVVLTGPQTATMGG